MTTRNTNSNCNSGILRQTDSTELTVVTVNTDRNEISGVHDKNENADLIQLSYQANPDPHPTLGRYVQAINDIVSNRPWDNEELPAKINSWLYLCDFSTVYNLTRLYDAGITHVITTNTLDMRSRRPLQLKLAASGIVHKYVQGVDYEGYEMINNHWDDCRAFLEEAKKGSPKVAIHCSAGCNRSVVVVVAALLVFDRMTLLDAVNLVKSKRGTILHNRSFQTQLCELAKNENLLVNL